MKNENVKRLFPRFLMSLAVAIMPFAIVDAATYTLNNAQRVMHGKATDLCGATVGVIPNSDGSATAWAIDNTLGGSGTAAAPYATARYWTVKNDNNDACATGTAPIGQNPLGTGYLPSAITQDDGGRLIIPQGAGVNEKLTWRWVMSRIASSTNMYPETRRYFSLTNASGYTTDASADMAAKAVRVDGDFTKASESDMMSVWYCPANQKYIYEVLYNGSGQGGINRYATGLSHVNGEYATAKYYDKANKKILLTTASGIYDCTLSGSGTSGTMKTTKITVKCPNQSSSNKTGTITATADYTRGATMIMFAGHKILCTGVGSTSDERGWTGIFDVTNGYPGTLMKNLPDNGYQVPWKTYMPSASAPLQFVWMHAIAESSTVLNVYAFYQGAGFAKFKMTASEVTAAAPTISPNGGTFTAAQEVTMSTTTSGAAIYYTTDGTAPATSATGSTKLYSGKITISASGTTTIRAIAVAAGKSSGETKATFNINYPLPTAPVNNLTATINDEGRAVITWQEPTYDKNAANLTHYILTLSGEISGSYTVSGTSYTTAVLGSSNNLYVSVVPYYNLKANTSVTGAGSESSVTVARPENAGPPASLNLTEYQGRATVEIKWTKPANPYTEANRYNVYRDGSLIASNLAAFSYVDTDVSEGSHTYKVVSIYNGVGYDDWSLSKTIIVHEFNNANVAYSLEPVYDYIIGKDIPVSGDGYDNLNKRDFCRQGAVYDGKWYIILGAHSTSTTGGIITFDIDNPKAGGKMLTNLVNPEYTNDVLKGKATQITNVHGIGVGQSAGLAFDDAGNLFVRTWWAAPGGEGAGGTFDAGVGLKRGVVYQRQANGDYTNGIVVDMSSLGLATTRSTNVGRCDYYSFIPGGNIYGANGADLLLAVQQPSGGKNFVIANLKANGSTINCTVKQQLATTTPMSSTNAESYAFPNQTNTSQYIVQARSDSYGLFSSSAAGNEIYRGEGVASNPGGWTMKWGDDYLLITPYGRYSANNGDFRIALGKNGSFKSADLVPIASVGQSVLPSLNLGYQSNGVWMYAKENEEDKCVYIYIYVPGVRFLKYKLTRNADWPDPVPSITYTPIIGASDNNPSGDLLGFNMNLAWSRPQVSGSFYPTSGEYSLINYEYSVKDRNNSVYTDGKSRSFDNEVKVDNSNSITISDALAIYACDEDFSLSVRANYQTSDNPDGSIHHSRVVPVSKQTTYSPVPPQIQAKTYYMNNYKITEWWGGENHNLPGHHQDGWVEVLEFDAHHVELTIDRPSSSPSVAGVNIPVSYYKIEVSKDGGATWEPIRDMPLAESRAAGLAADDGVSYTPTQTTYGAYYKGNYDFAANTQYSTMQGHTTEKCNIAFDYYVYKGHHPLNATLSRSTYSPKAVDYSETPTNWMYRATAVYGASNAKTTKSGVVSEATQETITSVAPVQMNASVEAYPNPTDGVIRVSADNLIERIEIFSIAGSLIRNISLAGESSVATIDISDLASGAYLMRVNGSSRPMTIIRK